MAMNILFITFKDIMLGGEDRSLASLCTLAEAGYEVDVIASRVQLPSHPKISILTGSAEGSLSKHRLRMEVLKAFRRKSYDVVHAVDDAALFVSSVGRLRKARLVYDAQRCFSGLAGRSLSRLARFSPRYVQRLEKRLLNRATVVLSPCESLSMDLQKLLRNISIVQVEDVPIQSLFLGSPVSREMLLNRFDVEVSSVAVCSLTDGTHQEIRNVLLSIHKMIHSMPHIVFFIKGIPSAAAREMATNLEIVDRCCFLEAEEVGVFLAALEFSDVALLVPSSTGRYVDSEVYSILQASTPLVAVQLKAYENLLTEKNSIQVLSNSDSLAEGMLQILREPLFSFGIATAGQQLVADRYSLSSFKHKIRMAYHEII